YNANNEELEELFNACEDDPPTPQCDTPSTAQSENASPKKGDKTPSIIDKYFKSMRSEKPTEKEKTEDAKSEAKDKEESRSSTPKEISSSPMKEYLNRLGKKSTLEGNPDVKEGSNETWKIFHDFKFKIAQAVSSLESSIQNLSELTQPITAKATEHDLSLPVEKNHSDSSDDTHKNLAYSEMANVRDYFVDSLLEVESGIEALEDTMDGFGDVTSLPVLEGQKNVPTEGTPNPPQPPTARTNISLPPSKPNLPKNKLSRTKTYFLTFTMYFLTIILIINFVLFPNANVWNGFLLGIWSFSLGSNVKSWLLDNYFSHWEPQNRSFFQLKRSMAKRELWDEKIDQVLFYQHRLYNLSGARIILLPKG
ncbi:Testis-expressed sequence 2 protein, partial [Operophtera brumata]